jgi:hypothetical protein
VRAVGIEAVKGQVAVNVVLREQPRQYGLTNAALLAANEVDVVHGVLMISTDVRWLIASARAGGRGIQPVPI